MHFIIVYVRTNFEISNNYTTMFLYTIFVIFATQIDDQTILSYNILRESNKKAWNPIARLNEV